MSNAHELARGHKRLLPLIEYALSEGWEVVRTPGGHLKFTRPGLPPIFTSATASDHRGAQRPRHAAASPAWARTLGASYAGRRWPCLTSPPRTLQTSS